MHSWAKIFGILFLSASAASALPNLAKADEVPERFRLDLSALYFVSSDSDGYLDGTYAPIGGLVGPTRLKILFDLTGNLNVTDRLSLALGLAVGILEDLSEDSVSDLFEEETETVGIGDAHGELGLHLLRERRFFPSVSVRLGGSAPTAKYAGLGNGLWRGNVRVTLSKSFHPRFSVFATSGLTHFLDDGDIHQEETVSYGGGVSIGVTRSTLLTVYAEEATGGEMTEIDSTLSAHTQDLRAGLGFTVFSKGRPRFSARLSAGNLRNDAPRLLLSFTVPVLSF